MMEHRRRNILYTVIILTNYIYLNNACEMQNVNNWLVPVSTSVYDNYTGIILARDISNIEGINTITYGEGTNRGPYLDVSLTNSQFVIATNDDFVNYEEHETSRFISITVNFRCSGTPSTRSLVVSTEVVDTNNNAPQFIPTNEFAFIVAPPLPPGYLITGCLNDIIVRDIDLTTYRIDFGIEDNLYFEIEYDAEAITEVKEFKAILKTATFIRSIPEPIIFRITATDVDETGDPQITTSATVTIIGDSEFEFPEEPVFTQAFYLANYSDYGQVTLYQPISLQSGYHEDVRFTLDGEYSNNFELVQNDNQITLSVATPLSPDVLMENQIFLVVRADREYASGGSATIVIQLPEDVALEFDRAHYNGTIENNILQIPQLLLTQGYQDRFVLAVVVGDYSSYFNATVQGNAIDLTMTALNENIIEQNNFIYLQVDAIADRSIATTVVTLEIIKDDNDTPIFDKPIYTGTYDPNVGLTLEQILLVQGYDETVTVSVNGDHAGYFQLVQNGSVLTLSVSTIPSEIYIEQRILLSVEATKPRTVGATAAVVITLPAARQLDFEKSTYRGSLQDDVLNLDSIVLVNGYDENVGFTLSGDYDNYFSISHIRNVVTVNLTEPIPEVIVLENNIIILTITASGLNALTTTTTVLLDVIKDDISTPMFSRNIYVGNYVGSLTVDIEDINLVQGFADTVTFRLDGDHSQYFEISSTENSVGLSLRSTIPEDIIFDDKVLVFNILADKALTVGANAAIVIKFPTDLTDLAALRFSQNTYVGSIEDNNLRMDDLVLNEGYAPGTEFLLTGDYATYFALTNINNVVSVTLISGQLSEILRNNTFIVLEIEARRERAIPVWTSIVIDIIKEDILPPVFTRAYYTGAYSEDTGLQFYEEISLYAGYDENVVFSLEGEYASYFNLNQMSNSLNVTAVAPLPESIVSNNTHLLLVVAASKPETFTGRATISITLNKDGPQIINFDRVTYMGSIENNTATIGPITLNEGNTDDVSFTLFGELSTYFALAPQGSVIAVTLQTPIPAEAIPTNRIIVLEIQASAPQAVAASATLIFEVYMEEDVPTVIQSIFQEAYYTGSYNSTDGLLFENPITLIQGYDADIQFTLEGENSQWFGLTQTENSVTLTVTSPIPEAVLAANTHLVFMITAQRAGSATARSTIVISITEDLSEDAAILGFDKVTYMGSIENNTATIGPITLSEGNTDDVSFTLFGELSTYFALAPQGSVIAVILQTPIPAEAIPTNRIIVLEIQASAPQAVAASATLIFEVYMEEDNPTVIQPIFQEAYYTGSYNSTDGLLFVNPITLAQGYDADIQFTLEGENSQWFGLTQTENSVTLTVTSPIPGAVLAANTHLVFMITAQRAGSATARSTIVISITEDLSEDAAILGFDRVTYMGSIENNTATIGPITLNEGNTDDVSFTLFGELSTYFALAPQGSVIAVTLQTPIPVEAIPTNRIIVLEIQASAPQAVAASATLIFEVYMEEDVPTVIQPIFLEAYYTGSYNSTDGLLFENPITLAQGYDADIQFTLEGENSQWFGLTQTENSVTLTVTSPIPGAVLAANTHLVFMITAQRAGSATARSTIVISITEDLSEDAAILGFDRVTYMGSIENNTATIGPITLNEGNTDDVSFTLFGELSTYFALAPQGSVIAVTLQTPIPVEAIPTNRIIVLEIQVSAPQAVAASATLIFEVYMEEDVPTVIQPIFQEAYYTGSYNSTDGLLFENPITLAQGYDADIQFTLEGENSQWFGLIQTENSVTLTVTSPIPGAVLAANTHLVFMITAQRAGSATARSTIVISITEDLSEDAAILGFDKVTYMGSIENNTATIGPITLSEGNTDDVSFTLFGELSTYFALAPQGSVIAVILQTPIPAEAIPTNRIIVLEIQASAPQAVAASATLIFEVYMEEDNPTVIQPIFQEAYYTGSYNSTDGLLFENPITLAQGYDADIQFTLEGENSQWFGLTQTENSVTLTVTSPIPGAVLAANTHLVFMITAQRAGSATARSTIVISITEDLSEDAAILGFDRVTYMGSIENNTATIGPITLNEGNTDDVSFTLFGELSTYFALAPQGSVIAVTLQTPIPVEAIPTNRIIVLEIQASAPQAVAASATLIFEVYMEEDVPTVIQPIFLEAYYTGSYNSTDGLLFENPITLIQGYDADIQFTLEGENSQWFGLTQTENSVTLTVTSPIPGAVLAANTHLVFMITAQRAGSATARSTIVISITEDLSEDAAILGFDRVTYMGSIENNTATIGPITLNEGNTDDVSFTLFGELSTYFALAPQGSVIAVTLQTPIPVEAIPTNRIIVLEIQVSAPQAVAASATLIFEVYMEEDVPTVIQPIFQEAYYTGSYNSTDGLLFENPITLAQGYDADIQFTLEGENSQWFGLTQTENSVTLTVTSPIPGAVLAANTHLVFMITAQRAGSATARSTIVISITEDLSEDAAILGFDRVTYMGSIENNTATIGPITLNEGNTDDVSFTLFGELSTYFALAPQGSVIAVILQTPIPAEAIPTNRIIVLEIQASAPQAVAASATLIFEVYMEEDNPTVIQPIFQEAYYTGSYNSTDGLLFENPITLAQGYDADIQFTLEGENSQWFGLTQTENSVTLTVTSPIPGAVLAANTHLVFMITAQRAGNATARSTIVISITEDLSEDAAILGFDRVTYMGSIENNTATIGPITLNEGNTDDVSFTLFGELSTYFALAPQGSVIAVILQTPIPAEAIPTNRIIVLEIQASAPQAVAASATLIFEVYMEEDNPTVIQPIFQEAYYTGSYNSTDGLLFENPITLAQGYDADIQFTLEGENSQWFGLTQTENSVTLTVTSPIPGAVLAANTHLVFMITAQRAGSATARSTIVISITEDLSEDAAILGFDRVTYMGSIENNTVTIGPITLSEGNTDDVSFTLFGELSTYFALAPQGSVITVILQTPIPAEAIPTNRIIVLEIQASAPQAVAASATLIFEVYMEEDVPTVIQPIFQEAYYTGSYNSTNGLLFENPITLAQGYDADIQFTLEGENSQWFGLTQTENSVTLTVTSPIPGAVLAANTHLVLMITAQRAGSATARSTIVISITEDLSEDAAILGFDRVTYMGSIENNTVTIGPITLSEGNTDDVSFTLFGELSTYFALAPQGSVIAVILQTPIPAEAIPTNRIIVLEIQASAPQAVAASATLIFEVYMEEDNPTVIQPIFQEAYYTGSYNSTDGLLFENPITLAQGYDADIQFTLEGENSQWFGLTQTENSVTLTVTSPIPGAVLAANTHLVFMITAQRAGSATARSTIVISITEDLSEDAAILGFDRVTYMGSIENNTATIGPITLNEGNTDDVSFTLFGELSTYFALAPQGSVIAVTLQTPIPVEAILTNRIIVLEIQASAPQAVAASATLIFEVYMEEDVPTVIQPIFQEAYYTGSYNSTDGLLFENPITLIQGYDADIQFTLEGENSQWFGLTQTENSVTLTVTSPIPGAVLAANTHLVFMITAQRAGSATVRSTIVISITEDLSEDAAILGFDRVTYMGSIENNTATIGPITLNEGNTDDVSFTLFGELSTYFALAPQGSVIAVTLQTPIPVEAIPTNRIIVLEIQASAPQAVAASATLIFEVYMEEDVPTVIQPIFQEAYYTGSYNSTDGLLFENPITLIQGYDADIQFTLEGDNSQWFSLVQTDNSVMLTVISPIPTEVLQYNRKLIYVITARRENSPHTARATIIISLFDDPQTGNDVSFEKVLYEGIIQGNAVLHESITISGYTGTTVDLYGEYSSLFVASVTNGLVTVQASGALTLPTHVTAVPLVIQASEDRAVLLLTVLETDAPAVPMVAFSSPFYTVSVEIVQTGWVGRVHATADNGETIVYSLLVENEHLQSRIAINNEGELHLSAPANSGVYTFEVVATTAITQASATATVYLSVEAITVCGENDIVVPPLIILDRDEEEPHRSLVLLNSTQYAGCQFTLTNRWPTDQSWLYVDEIGLHTTAIDREHPSIAFMALSQIKVELFLRCDEDDPVRTKRSERTEWPGPYDYGTYNWILADSISYNSRRTVVNLIVNDINDNEPIFVGKEDEPIIVGYPNAELEESILPRSLAELQATDADIGENAQLLYWSTENELAVAPMTGFVHLRSGAQAQHNQVFVVHATDRNGEGLTGSIQLLVKVLDIDNIVVVTIQDAFLDDEKTILTILNEAVGYEVKTLKSVVISDNAGVENSRKKREANTTGSLLQLYVYGLIEREPVAVDRLSADINNNAAAVVNVISTLPLEDHIESSVIPGRDTGLLVSTIVLSVLLFILIALIGLWYFLRWRQNRNYDEFSDENSLASRNNTMDSLPKAEVFPKPRLNIEELRKSERRLQEMLNTPMEDTALNPEEPSTSTNEKSYEAVLDLSLLEPPRPIVIQSIDKLKDAEDDSDDDEFGEKSGARRKSVVTFNENVEKIIHVEDSPDEIDDNEHLGYEIYKF